ncbi:MAG: efflux transporter outer membrane subunit [Comamonas sp.]|nr:efflux transporter outer membrane subunit [Comamonas sp.]
MLTGCSLVPQYERPASKLPQQFEGSSAQAAASQIAAPTWEQFFTDPLLQSLIRTALAGNHDLRVASLRLSQAQAQFDIQRAALLPTLSGQGNASRGHNASGDIGNAFNAGVVVPAWELDFFGRIRALKEQALAQYLATDEARQSYELALVSSVAQSWMTLIAAQEQLALTERTLQSRQASLQLMHLRWQSGLSSELDYRQAQSQAEAAGAALAEGQRLQSAARSALALLLGQNALPENAQQALADPASARLEALAPLPVVAAGLPSELLTRRPDIRQAEQQLIAANAQIGVARAAFYPSISLTGQFGSVSTELSNLFKSGSWGFNLGAALNLPIFTGGRNRANLQVAQAEREIMLTQYDKAIQSAFKEVSDALQSHSRLAEQARAQAAQLQAERRRLELAELRYQHGVASHLDVLDAQRSLFALEQAELQTRLAEQLGRIALFKAMGGSA